jgi:hypothetical protein
MTDSLLSSEDASPATAADDAFNLPPGRLNVVRTPDQRLTGSLSAGNLASLNIDNNSLTSPTTLYIPPTLNSTLKKLPRSLDGSGGSRSRSISPSLHHHHKSVSCGERTPSTYDANSSLSSLDDIRDIRDQDILTDRAGLVESIDLAKERMNHNSFTVMPPVTERMSDEALEDSHAFSDVRSYSSRNSLKGLDGNDISIALEPLNECDESDDDLEDIDEELDGDHNYDDEQPQQQQIILTNLDNLTLNHGSLRDGESEPLDAGSVSATG